MVNRILGIESFLRSWSVVPENPVLFPIRRGATGHRNLIGSPQAPAVILGMWQPQFVESLETGVRDLVLSLIRRFSCVTYSSCEGHVTEDGSAVLCGRNVAILCRDAEEHERLRYRLEAAVQRVSTPMTFVLLQVADNVLETDVADMRCLDLNFVPLTPVPEQYFAELELVYDDLLHQIEHF
jgi:hypothetical protein